MTLALLLICKTVRKSERMVVLQTFLQFTHEFSEGFALFEFGEILAFISFHFKSDLLGETVLPNGLKKFIEFGYA